MNVQFNSGAVSSAARAPGSAGALRRNFFLVTPSDEQCGVESFARLLVNQLDADYSAAGYGLLPVSPRWRDLPALLRQVRHADCIVFSVPLTSWKKLLVLPLVILLFARCVGCRVAVFMHEWAGLHRLRRIAFAPFVWFSSAIIVVSPLIAGEIAQTRWLPGMGKKCRLVPNAPTVWPGEPLVTERVEQVRKAANNCDIVIGHFGALYKGKASTALLDVCHYLRGRGVRALIVFIGSFPPSLDGYEQQFWAKVTEYGIEDQVIVTGYVSDDAELYTLFSEVGVFLYLFAEGLTARRSSVIHCLQSNRPVVVTEPRSMNEFAHHRGFQSVIASGALSFIPAGASPQTIADRLFDLAKRGGRTTQAIDSGAWWRATTAATHAALSEGRLQDDR
jgi:glycosyltransferase involved in cell wall biosynthesis